MIQSCTKFIKVTFCLVFSFILLRGLDLSGQNLNDNLKILSPSSQFNIRIDSTEIIFILNGCAVSGKVGIEILKRGEKFECLIFEKVDLMLSSEKSNSKNEKIKFIYFINNPPILKK